MVVLVIISMGMFLLVPKVVSGLLERRTPVVEELDSVLKEAKKEAMKKRQKVAVRFLLGGEHFYLDEREHSFPGDRALERVWLNERQAQGMEITVNAYPDGICDYFVLELSGGMKIRSIPLLCEVRVEKGSG